MYTKDCALMLACIIVSKHGGFARFDQSEHAFYLPHVMKGNIPSDNDQTFDILSIKAGLFLPSLTAQKETYTHGEGR